MEKRRLARASGVVAGGECGSYPFTADGDDPRVDLPLARGAGCPATREPRGWNHLECADGIRCPSVSNPLAQSNGRPPGQLRTAKRARLAIPHSFRI